MLKRLTVASVFLSCSLSLLLLAGCFESKEEETAASAYVGTWLLSHTATTPGSGDCGGDLVGVAEWEGPIAVDADGHFTLPDDGDDDPATGTISATGAVSLNIPAHMSDSTSCPGGSATGSCPNPDSCAGTWAADGQTGTWVMARLEPDTYAGVWYLHHTQTVDDTTECEGDSLGVEQTEGPFVVGTDGTFTLVDDDDDDSEDQPTTGTITAGGVVTIMVPEDPPGQGNCSAALATGNCSSTSNCSGTYVQGGDEGVWSMTRTP